MRRFLFCSLLFALAACASDEPFAPEDPSLATEIADAKADGAFGVEEIALGDSATGEAGGSAFSLFAIDLNEGDEFTVELSATAGDLNPAGYLYFGTDSYQRPASYDVGDQAVTLNYVASRSGLFHIVVKAYREQGTGSFSLATACTGGPCAGISNDPIARASTCIMDAAECSLLALPDYGGRVGAARARSIFEGCLADGPCNGVCDGDNAETCDRIIDELPALADTRETCHGELIACFDACREIEGYYTAETLEDSAAGACFDGYNGNCLDYMNRHTECGGDELVASSTNACEALCDSSEGAFDEGPFDGCYDGCSDTKADNRAYIDELSIELGEFFDIEDYNDLFPVTDEYVPAAILAAARSWASDNAEEGWTLEVREGETIEIRESGNKILGWILILDDVPDDNPPLFDGAGYNLYLDGDGDAVHATRWEG